MAENRKTGNRTFSRNSDKKYQSGNKVGVGKKADKTIADRTTGWKPSGKNSDGRKPGKNNDWKHSEKDFTGRKSGKTAGYKPAGKNFDDRKPVNRTDTGRKEAENKTFEKKQPTGGCSHAKKCGGCQYQSIPYEKQLRMKQKMVEELLRPFGKVEKIIGMKDPKYYRNKVHHVFARDQKGQIIAGNYQANSHRVVPVSDCLIEDKKSQEIIETIRQLAKSFKIRIYDEDTDYGLLRHVMVRRGFTSGEIMVILVLRSPILPSKNNFVKALREKHPEITTIVINVNDKRTNMVLGSRDILLYGPGFIKDTLCGCTFRISPQSFYQVNPVQTEVLYRKAVEYAELTGKETVIDAYCGIGTIGMIAAKHAGKVLGIELNGDAVRDARVNTRENQMRNIQFEQGDAGDYMQEMAMMGESADVVFMDPPRSGSTEIFMESVVKMGPKKVVYVSCNPETLAKDLAYFAKHGYAVKKMQPVDMFPATEHVETVCLLSNRKPDSYVHLNLKMEDYYRIKDAQKEQDKKEPS